MKIGDTVDFQITGMIGRYRGRIVKLLGHSGRPEIEVTHRFYSGIPQLEALRWPILKDGDYILYKDFPDAR